MSYLVCHTCQFSNTDLQDSETTVSSKLDFNEVLVLCFYCARKGCDELHATSFIVDAQVGEVPPIPHYRIKQYLNPYIWNGTKMPAIITLLVLPRPTKCYAIDTNFWRASHGRPIKYSVKWTKKAFWLLVEASERYKTGVSQNTLESSCCCAGRHFNMAMNWRVTIYDTDETQLTTIDPGNDGGVRKIKVIAVLSIWDLY